MAGQRIIITNTGSKGGGTWATYGGSNIVGGIAWVRSCATPRDRNLPTGLVIGQEYDAFIEARPAREARVVAATATTPERHFDAQPASTLIYIRFPVAAPVAAPAA